MKLTQIFIKDEGISLIATALMIVLLGTFISSGTLLYSIWENRERQITTNEKLEFVQGALHDYLTRNGRYPCPASFTTPIDGVDAGTGVVFGTEVLTDCTLGPVAGTFRATGPDGKFIRTGALPVRTLNIPDEYMFDGYRQRLVYAVTEENAVDGVIVSTDNGDITILDRAGNNATSQPGNIVQVVYSMGQDFNGAYDVDGNLISPCDPAAPSGENCDFAANASFVSSPSKSSDTANLFDSQITYPPSRTVLSCNNSGFQAPKDVAFLVDTSGSMNSGGFCPHAAGCRRIHDVQWAMRRTMLARFHANSTSSEAGTTSITGFVANNTVENVANNLGNIIFDDPTVAGYQAPDEAQILSDLETELQSLCASGPTPLGVHIRALADRLGDGDPDRPNRITVLSDGGNTNGIDPVTVALQLQNEYPNLQVDIIDVVGNPQLKQVSDLTGGAYFRTDNPTDLLDALNLSAGVCSSFTPNVPADPLHCGGVSGAAAPPPGGGGGTPGGTPGGGGVPGGGGPGGGGVVPP